MFTEAMFEHVGQPVIGPVDPSTLLAPITSCATHRFDFNKDSVELLKNFTIPFSFTINRNDVLHGLACWFDVGFMTQNSTTRITLSTSPTSPATHWYQCRLVFQNPFTVKRGQIFTGSCLFIANDNSSYDITVKAQIKGIGSEITNKFLLHNVLFRCYWASTSPATASTSSPSIYDMSSTAHSSTYLPTGTSYQPTTPSWVSGIGHQQPVWTPSPQTGWLGHGTAPLSPRRKMARLSPPGGSLLGGMQQLSYGQTDFSMDTRTRPTHTLIPPSRTYAQGSLGYGYDTSYTTNPYYGYGYNGSYGNGTTSS